jgi:hypothetical protein
MATTLRQLCRPLIALVAIFAAPLASEASAGSTMKPGPGACATVCGCCSPEAIEAPTNRAGVTERVALTEAPALCEPSPGGGCLCRSQEPAAPSPKPARSTAEGRSEQDQAPEFVHLGEAAGTQDLLSPQVISTQCPPKIRLYLRNARLLF